MAEKNRGTTNELEILKEIINENRGLQQRVLDKIRFIRAQTKGNIFEDTIKKETDKKESSKKKKKKD